MTKSAAATIGKMFVIGRFASRKFFSGMQQLAVLQNVKRRTIDRFSLLLAPVPEFAQNSRCSTAQRARTGNSPRFVDIALAVDRGQLERTLTRLPEPLHSISRVQFGFQTLSQWQEIARVVDRIFGH